MNTKLLLGILLLLSAGVLSAQEVYTTSSGEIIFSGADMALKSEFKESFSEASIEENPVRFTCFFHAGTYVHVDFNNVIGLYSGLALRNVGFVSNEVLPTVLNPTADDYQDYKIVRRTYNLGIPLALKLGSFKNNFYIFGGGEIEWAFVSKTKWWESHDRKGNKTKNVDWFPNDFNSFMPSVFGGVNFAGGVHLKFKYYLNNLIDNDKTDQDEPLKIDNLYRYEDVQMMYISLSFQLDHEKVIKTIDESRLAMY